LRIDASRWLLGGTFPAALALLWEALSRAGVLSEDGFSRPSRFLVAGAKALADGALLQQTAETFGAAALALCIAAAAGILGGTLIGLSRPLERATTLTIDLLRPIPSVALIPLSLLVFGFSRNMSAAVAAFACVWPILITSAAAVRGIDPRLLEVGRMLGFSSTRRLWKFALPAAVPGIMVGVRVAAGIAIVVTVTTEIVSNPRGLGYAMTSAAQSLQADLAWATLLWIGLVGWTLNAAMLRLEQRWLRWYWASRE
jgi:ABC-type nitrate/sulfonate/bicarbonate transport system permease component